MIKVASTFLMSLSQYSSLRIYFLRFKVLSYKRCESNCQCHVDFKWRID